MTDQTNPYVCDYNEEKAEAAFLSLVRGAPTYPADEWGNPKNRKLAVWFSKFRNEEHARHEELAEEYTRRGEPYFD